MRQLKPVLWYGALLIGVLTALSTIYGVYRHYSPLPFWDQWDGELDVYVRTLQQPLSALFEQHNEHRLAVSRILFFIDLRYFGGRNTSLLIENLMLAGLLALTMYRIAVHRSDLSSHVRAGMAGIVLMGAYSWMQSENFTWGFQSQWFAIYLFALCALHAIALSTDALSRQKRGVANRWLAAALLSSTLATYSMSSGLLVFPVVMLLAWYYRLDGRRLGAIALTTILIWLAYFYHWQTPDGSATPKGALHHVTELLTYFLYYLGAPAQHAHLGSIGAVIFGLIAVILLVAQLSRIATHPSFNVKAPALLAFTLFVTGNALITAYGRYEGGLTTAFSFRYTTASLNGWLALLIYTYLNAQSGTIRRAAATFAAILMLILIPIQHEAVDGGKLEVYLRNVAGLALRAHVYDARFTEAVFPAADALAAISRKAEAAHISIFSPGQRDFYEAPSITVAGSQCEGYIDHIGPTSTPGVLVADGWIYDKTSHTVPRFIVITDARGNTLGTGLAGGIRDDVSHIYGHDARYSQWTAFISATPGSLIWANGTSGHGPVCRIDTARLISPVT